MVHTQKELQEQPVQLGHSSLSKAIKQQLSNTPRPSVFESVPQRGSVWVGHDRYESSVRGWRRPTRYRVVVLTPTRS